MRRAPANLRLHDGEELLWVGRPKARPWWDVIDGPWDAWGLALAGILAVGGLAVALVLGRPTIGWAVATIGPFVILAVWFTASPRHHQPARRLTDRYVVTSRRAAIVKAAAAARRTDRWTVAIMLLDWVPINPVAPVVRELPRRQIAEWRRYGPHLIVYEAGRPDGAGLVFGDVDDPGGGSRALDDLLGSTRVVRETT